MAPPVGYKRQPSLADQIREMVRSERLAMEAENAGYETFEEADDFDVGDDYDPQTPYENEFDTPLDELKRRRDIAEEEKPSPPEPKEPAKPGRPEPVQGEVKKPPQEGE
ncbi:hypothetical protein [Flyfo microvirus Tbat2_151]|nr:hypothetical protein [Flyfo microvirus Tbat2_151]